MVGIGLEITPKDFVDWLLKEEKRTNNFSNEMVFTRSAIAQYKEALLQIANVHISGKRIQFPYKYFSTFIRMCWKMGIYVRFCGSMEIDIAYIKALLNWVPPARPEDVLANFWSDQALQSRHR